MNSNWSYSLEKPNLVKIEDFLAVWPCNLKYYLSKTLGCLFYATSSFVHHFVAICIFFATSTFVHHLVAIGEFKLK